jgi:glycosyltransferase involved in cell wall biosynthesis
VFTLVYNRPAFVHTPLASREVRTSILDRWPWAHRNHRILLPFMPAAIVRFDLRPYDLVVSFSYAVAHGVRRPAGASHVSYTYTPMRYAWSDMNIRGERKRKGRLAELLLDRFRAWDRQAAGRVDRFAAVSHSIAGRVRKAYLREATVLYPPVEVEQFRPFSPRGDHYLTVSRLVPHKRVDLIVEAFTRLGSPLMVIGEGPELPRLKRLAGPNIQFRGFVSEGELSRLLGKARGFVSASEEDFGIAIVEAQAAGCPVIAYGRGGALETVIEGETGLLFDEQSISSLFEAVRRFEGQGSRWDPGVAVDNARRFSKDRFLAEFAAFAAAGDYRAAALLQGLPLPVQGFQR